MKEGFVASIKALAVCDIENYRRQVFEKAKFDNVPTINFKNEYISRKTTVQQSTIIL